MHLPNLRRSIVRILVMAFIALAGANQVAAQSPQQPPEPEWRVSHLHAASGAPLSTIRVRLVLPSTEQTLSSAATRARYLPTELARQIRRERSPMLFPVIGLLAGGAAGYFLGRNTPHDAYVSRVVWTIPLGAAAGFVVGIMAEDITSRID